MPQVVVGAAVAGAGAYMTTGVAAVAAKVFIPPLGGTMVVARSKP